MSDSKTEAMVPEAEIARFDQTCSYKQLKQLKSDYRFTRLTQETNGTDVQGVSLTGETTSQFNIPVGFFNRARSRLRFTVTHPLEGGKFLNVPRDRFPYISSVYGETEQGTRIMQQNYVAHYGITARMVNTSFSKQQTKGEREILQKANSASVKRSNNTAINGLYTEPLPLTVIEIDAAAGVINYDVALGDIFPDGYLGLDKTMYIGHAERWIFTWAVGQAYGWTSTSATNPTAGAAALVSVPTITNLNLYLSTEENEGVKNSLMQLFNGGQLRYMFGNPQTIPNVLTSATEHNVVIRGINRSQGLRLQKITHNCFARVAAGPSVQTVNNRFACIMSGVEGTYFTSINDERRQKYDVSLTNFEDAMIHKDILETSCITSTDQYKFTWFHSDHFNSNFGPDDKPKNFDRIQCGIDLTTISELKWSLTMSLVDAAGISHYTHFLYQREMFVSKDSVRVL